MLLLYTIAKKIWALASKTIKFSLKRRNVTKMFIRASVVPKSRRFLINLAPSPLRKFLRIQWNSTEDGMNTNLNVLVFPVSAQACSDKTCYKMT